MGWDSFGVVRFEIQFTAVINLIAITLKSEQS